MPASSRTVIVCLAEHEWSPLPSREQHLMERLSRHVDVVYVNPMLRAREWPFPDRTIQISPGLWVHEALPLPGARRFSWARWMTTARLARQLARWQREEGTFVLWICSPTGFPFIELLHPDRVVYDMADLQATPRGRQADEDERRQIETLAELERPLLAQSDLTLCASTSLAEWVGTRSRRVHVVPNGCEPSRHRAATAAIASPGATRIGFLGAIAPHLDIELIASVARARPDWTIELVGPTVTVDTSSLLLPNVERSDAIPIEDALAKLTTFDVCLLPFREIDFVYYGSPAQAFDYLAAGKPIVSTPIGQIEEWRDLVSVARGAQEFVSAIGELAETASAEFVTKRRVHAARSSWDVRLAQVADALAGIGVDIEHQLRLVHREQAPVQEQTVWPPLGEAVC